MPKLRFKDSRRQEFPEWINQRIGEVSIKVISGGTPDTNNARYWNGNINWLTPKEINSKYVKSSLRKISELGNQKSSAKLLPKGTVILTTRASIGLCCIQNTDSSFTTNQGFQSILFNPEKVYSEYGYYFLIRDETQRKMKQLASGSTFLELSPKNLKKLNIPVPSLPEQQKIADFLTAYDTMIDIQSQRVEAMRTRKKGLLQKIFSQEIRFKDDEGKDYPEWDEKKIGEFSQCIAGATPSTKEPRYWENGNIPWMSSGEVNNRIICSTEKKISSLGYENSSTKMLPENTVVIALAGQGKTRGMVAITRIRLCTNQSLCGIVTDSSILSDYLYQFLLTQYEYLRLISSGDGTRGGLNLKIVKDCNIPVPTLPEQQKIADFLTAVDKQIEIEEKRLETMKTIKKGLLQQMFI